MAKACTTPHGMGSVTRSLKKFYAWRNQKEPEREDRAEHPEGQRAVSVDVYDKAMERIKLWVPALEEIFAKQAAKPVARRRYMSKEERAAKLKEEAATQWKEAKEKQQSTMASPLQKRKRDYRAEVLDDQRRAKRRFFPEAPRRPRAAGAALEEIVDNGEDLPPASYSKEAQGFQDWCLRGAWGMCVECQTLLTRNLHEIDLRQELLPNVRKTACRHCSGKRKHEVPKPEDVPRQLRGLSEEAVQALRVFDIDVGPEVRAVGGYRKHVRMFRLSWSAQSVKEKIRKLQDRSMQKKTKRALKYLRAEEASSYGEYFDYHRKFLHKHNGNPTPVQRLRPLYIIEEVGLECALWPHLYWRTEMCETWERATDERRLTRQGLSKQSSGRRLEK